jgi:hypothetical protein
VGGCRQKVQCKSEVCVWRGREGGRGYVGVVAVSQELDRWLLRGEGTRRHCAQANIFPLSAKRRRLLCTATPCVLQHRRLCRPRPCAASHAPQNEPPAQPHTPTPPSVCDPGRLIGCAMHTPQLHPPPQNHTCLCLVCLHTPARTSLCMRSRSSASLSVVLITLIATSWPLALSRALYTEPYAPQPAVCCVCVFWGGGGGRRQERQSRRLASM